MVLLVVHVENGSKQDLRANRSEAHRTELERRKPRETKPKFTSSSLPVLVIFSRSPGLGRSNARSCSTLCLHQIWDLWLMHQQKSTTSNCRRLVGKRPSVRQIVGMKVFHRESNVISHRPTPVTIYSFPPLRNLGMTGNPLSLPCYLGHCLHFLCSWQKHLGHSLWRNVKSWDAPFWNNCKIGIFWSPIQHANKLFYYSYTKLFRPLLRHSIWSTSFVGALHLSITFEHKMQTRWWLGFNVRGAHMIFGQSPVSRTKAEVLLPTVYY